MEVEYCRRLSLYTAQLKDYLNFKGESLVFFLNSEQFAEQL